MNKEQILILVGTITFGVVSLAMGSLLLATTLGYVYADQVFSTPPWMMWMGSFFFIFMGLSFIFYKVSEKITGLFGLVCFLLFLGLFNYVAFGPGERQFSQGTGVVNEPASEIQGRVVFGLIALGMDALLLYSIAKPALDKRRRIVPKNK